jgi:hypothetical protein
MDLDLGVLGTYNMMWLARAFASRAPVGRKLHSSPRPRLDDYRNVIVHILLDVP